MCESLLFFSFFFFSLFIFWSTFRLQTLTHNTVPFFSPVRWTSVRSLRYTLVLMTLHYQPKIDQRLVRFPWQHINTYKKSSDWLSLGWPSFWSSVSDVERHPPCQIFWMVATTRSKRHRANSNVAWTIAKMPLCWVFGSSACEKGFFARAQQNHLARDAEVRKVL